MNLQARVRRWLGIESTNNNVQDLRVELQVLHDEIKAYHKQGRVSALALGRIIAKLDPNYGRHENPMDDPGRREESDRLGAAVIKKLEGEEWAQRHNEGRE